MGTSACEERTSIGRVTNHRTAFCWLNNADYSLSLSQRTIPATATTNHPITTSENGQTEHHRSPARDSPLLSPHHLSNSMMLNRISFCNLCVASTFRTVPVFDRMTTLDVVAPFPR